MPQRFNRTTATAIAEEFADAAMRAFADGGTFNAALLTQALALVERSARTLARMIADTKAAFDCQCVVMGGSVGLAAGYLDRVKAALAQEPAIYHVELLPARYRQDAGLLGAALFAKE